MIATALFTALLPQAAVPVPPPIGQETANCAQPTYATDMIVCDDPELRALDERLRTVPRLPTPASALLEARTDWFRRSRRCAFKIDHRGCVLAAYRETLAVQAPGIGRAAPIERCRLRDGNATLEPVPGGAALVRGGQFLGVGLAASSAWQSFLRYERSGRRAIFRDLAGEAVARCNLAN